MWSSPEVSRGPHREGVSATSADKHPRKAIQGNERDSEQNQPSVALFRSVTRPGRAVSRRLRHLPTLTATSVASSNADAAYTRVTPSLSDALCLQRSRWVYTLRLFRVRRACR